MCSAALFLYSVLDLFRKPPKVPRAVLAASLVVLLALSAWAGYSVCGKGLKFIRELKAHVDLINDHVDFLWELKADEYRRAVLAQPGYQDPRRLNNYEVNVYSQAGEDGMLAEVSRRIGTTNKVFVEFGAGAGLEDNTVFLLRHGGLTVTPAPSPAYDLTSVPISRPES